MTNFVKFLFSTNKENLELNNRYMKHDTFRKQPKYMGLRGRFYATGGSALVQEETWAFKICRISYRNMLATK